VKSRRAIEPEYMQETENTQENVPPTAEDVKTKHEIMNKILSWGTLVFLLFVGYALNYHEKFEFFPTPEQTALVQAKREKALALNAGIEREADAVKAAEAKEKAAQSSLEARVLADDIRDAQHRAASLIFAATAFGFLYFFIIRAFYQKYEAAMDNYILPRKYALIYAAVIGLVTFSNGLLTAIF
jgi:hypothetical protein